ncbi:MAG: tRNA uridine(34) 5-carboxymethylaminomethyl modification radical SAM/GNAT enzyme Elp3 [Candidatus Gracilibacteria bacterium]|nr:tRNA uridine(34) 5-carboxymethylaminomethyl modification radical SAM/GNAT enzyme Elp3 [Candidatus Gracilibacteria bacterium]
MTDKTQIIDEILRAGLLELNPEINSGGQFTKDAFHKIKNKIYGKYKIEKPISSIEILERYNELIANSELEEDLRLKKILRKRGVRSLSGVTVISLLTESFGCPGQCIYCPTFEGLPKSYIPNEPAVQRAQLNKFDPVMQIHNRLRALEVTGHKIEKNDVRIIGGTWSVYPKEYQENFIKGIYDAFNSYDDMKAYIEKTDLSSDRFASFKIKESYKMKESKTLEEAKKLNQTARCRVIGIAIETRPDWITPKEIARLRRYGVTRVEIGYQTTIDEINKLNKRGHTNTESIKATKLLKDAGFKVVAHMMPNLLGSTPELDKKSLKEVFDNPDFRPDELKIYPMVVTDKSELTEVWKAGGFKAYDDETLIELTKELETMIPEYVRLNRTYRDIPASEILEGSKIANLRQIVEDRLKKEGVKLIDIRHREIKDGKNNPQNAVMHTFEYDASNGKEYFLTFEDPEDRTIFSLLRLRLPLVDKDILEVLPELNGAALIREIHTFGDQLSIGEAGSTFGQHLGFGKRLITEAESIAKKYGYERLAVIAGVGVRQYYEKRGYELEGEYMIKKLI